jgi:hypothetical protein
MTPIYWSSRLTKLKDVGQILREASETLDAKSRYAIMDIAFPSVFIVERLR